MPQLVIRHVKTFFCLIVLILGLNPGVSSASILEVAPPKTIFAIYVRDLDGAYALLDEWRAQLDGLGVGAQGLENLRRRAESSALFRLADRASLQKGGVDTRKGAAVFVTTEASLSWCFVVGLGIEDAFIKQLNDLLTETNPGLGIVITKLSEKPVRRYLFSGQNGQQLAHVVLRSGFAFISTTGAGVEFAERGAFDGTESATRFPDIDAPFDGGLFIRMIDEAGRPLSVPGLESITAMGMTDIMVRGQIVDNKVTINGSVSFRPEIAKLMQHLSPSRQKATPSKSVLAEADSFFRMYVPMDGVSSLLSELGLGKDHAVTNEDRKQSTDLRSDLMETFRGDVTVIVPSSVQHTLVELGVTDSTKTASIVDRIAREIVKIGDFEPETSVDTTQDTPIRTLRLKVKNNMGPFHPTWYWTVKDGTLRIAPTAEAITRSLTTQRPVSPILSTNTLLKKHQTSPSNLFFYSHVDSYFFSWNDYFAIGLSWLEQSGLYAQDFVDLWRLAQDRWVDLAVSGEVHATGIGFHCELTTLPIDVIKASSSPASMYANALRVSYAGNVVEGKRILSQIAEKYPESPHALKARRTLFMGGQRMLDLAIPATLTSILASTSFFGQENNNNGTSADGVGVPDPTELSDPCVKLAQEVCYTFGEDSTQCQHHLEAWNNPTVRYPLKRQKVCALELFEMTKFR